MPAMKAAKRPPTTLARLATIRSLPLEERLVLELLAVVRRSLKTAEAVHLCQTAGLKAPSGRRYSVTALRKLFREFRSTFLLIDTRTGVSMENDLSQGIIQQAAQEGRLDRTWEVLKNFDPTQDPADPRYWGDTDRSAWRHRVRMAVHANDRALLDRIRVEVRIDDIRWNPASRSALRDLFTEHFDRDWIASRLPEIRDEGLAGCISAEMDGYGQGRRDGNFARNMCERPDVSRELWELGVQRDLLRGDIPSARALLAADRWGCKDPFLAWIDCVQGRREAAIEGFRKTIGADPIECDPWFAPLFVLSLIGTGEFDLVDEASRFVSRAFPTEFKDSTAPPYTEDSRVTYGRVLRSLIDRAQGKRESARARAKKVRRAGLWGAAPLPLLLGQMALNWALKNGDQTHLHMGLQSARAYGYRWLEAEYLATLRRFSSANNRNRRLGYPPKPVDEWHAPMVDCLVALPDWKAGLISLKRIRRGPPKNAKKQPKREKRLAWLVRVNADRPELEAREQLRTRSGGWSKGRKVGIERLVEGRDLRYLSQRDWDVCEAIPDGYEYHRDGYDFRSAFGVLVGHPNVFHLDSPTTPVEIVRTAPQVHVSQQGQGIVVRLNPPPPKTGDSIVRAESDTRISFMAFQRHHLEIHGIVGRGGMRLPAGESQQLRPAIESLSKIVTVESDVVGLVPAAARAEADATPVMQITPVGDGMRVVPVVRPFGKEGPFLPVGAGAPTVFAHIKGIGQSRKRDLPLEERQLDDVASQCPSLSDTNWDGAQWVFEGIEACLELLDDLRAIGDAVRVVWPKGETLRVTREASTESLSLRIRSGTDWFSFTGRLKIDSKRVLTLQKLLKAMERASGRFIPLGKNQFLALTEDLRRRVDALSDALDRKGRQLLLPVNRALALEDTLAQSDHVHSDAAWKGHLKRIREARALDPAVPSTLQAELRPYQMDGFRWAARLAAWGAGACLADDMGLGKTMQALAVILTQTQGGPTLVVAPTSVCGNWIDETKRFAPTLRPARFGQGDRRAMLAEAGPFDVIVCSYGLLHHESDLLAQTEWQAVVLDEAQAIKNMDTMRWKAAVKLSGRFRMITTGTPIENHLGELFSLFEFVNPGLLGKPKDFSAKFANPIHHRRDHTARVRLRSLIRPFILRRTKAVVLDQLPPKTEVTLRVEMSPDERAFYEAVRQNALAALSGGQFSHMRVLAQITKLRQACCNPLLVNPTSDIPSSKLKTFLSTVSELVGSRHKALVFSQFVRHLSILRSELDKRGITYRYLDGSTPAGKRKQEIDAFQSGRGDLFLISLRAGGQGLNLTAADYVIHMDPWWNPAVEDQASDRAHRIGQTRPVTIYRLVMRDSIEEKIVDLHAHKRKLADDLLAGTELSGKLSADELLALVRGE